MIEWLSSREGSGENYQSGYSTVTVSPNDNPNGNKVPRVPKLPLIDDLSLLRDIFSHLKYKILIIQMYFPQKKK